MIFAQAANQPAHEIEYALLLSVIAVEITLSLLTWAAFNAESRVDKDRGADIRDATAGYSSGEVVPALARLMEDVLAVRRAGEDLRDALIRADTSSALDAVVEAAARSKSPRELGARLVRVWTLAGVANLVVQVSGPLLLLNEIVDEHVLSRTIVTASGISLIAGLAILAVALVLVRQLAVALTRATQAGKDAGDAA